MRRIVFLWLMVVSCFTVVGQELSTEETALYEMIMEYRAQRKLPAIALSASLTTVARAHVEDLAAHPPKGRCNLHSWSKSERWSRCCYTDGPKSYKCMWDKPRELTTYTGDGYEIAYWNGGGAGASDALAGWKKSKGHNTVIINKGIWKEVQWQAIGIAIYGEYAVVWFGKEQDL